MSIHHRLLVAVTAAAVAATPIVAAPSRVGTITVSGAWSRETAAGQTAGGGFVTLANSGAREDRLVSAASPVAAEVQLHTMSMDGGIMRMRQVTAGIPVPARGKLELRPGSFHIMFIGLKRPLHQGERIPVTLHFQRAGRVTIQFAVQPVGATGPRKAGHAGH